MNHEVRRLVWAALMSVGVASGSGCATALESQGTLPVAVTIGTAVAPSSGIIIITATLRNLTSEDVSLKVRCTPIELELDQNGTWIRTEDLRLCVPPDRTTLRASQSVQVQDERSLSPGRYRVVIESTDGRAAFSESFTVAPPS